MIVKRGLILLFWLCFFLVLGKAQEGFWPLSQATRFIPGCPSNLVRSSQEGGLMPAVIRLNTDCTGVLLSSTGLVLTDWQCLQESLGGRLPTKSFIAAALADEIPLADISAMQTVAEQLVTPQINAGITDELLPAQALQQQEVNRSQFLATIPAVAGLQNDLLAYPPTREFYYRQTRSFPSVKLVALISLAGSRQEGVALLRITTLPENDESLTLPGQWPKLALSTPGEERIFSLGYPQQSWHFQTATFARQFLEKELPLELAILRALNQAANPQGLTSSDPWLYQLRQRQQQLQAVQEQLMDRGYLATQIGKEAVIARTIQEQPPSAATSLGNAQQALRHSQRDHQKPQLALLWDRYWRDRGMPLLRAVTFLENLAGQKTISQRVRDQLHVLYQDFNANRERVLLAALLEIYLKNDQLAVAPYASELAQEAQKDYQAMAASLFRRSLLADPQQLLKQLDQEPDATLAQLQKDPLLLLVSRIRNQLQDQMGNFRQKKIQEQQFLNAYAQALPLAFPGQQVYPEANGTLRLLVGYRKKESFDLQLPAISGCAGAPIFDQEGRLMGILGNPPVSAAWLPFPLGEAHVAYWPTQQWVHFLENSVRGQQLLQEMGR
ncbi:MAG: S46 family peptidase [Lewinellaceae bacterium]|nr:S46 family peptidase [Lewinellaceae bacterium]